MSRENGPIIGELGRQLDPLDPRPTPDHAPLDVFLLKIAASWKPWPSIQQLERSPAAQA